MEKRFIIRDIITKKIYKLNGKVADFTNINSARDYLSWMPFDLGMYYEIYDNEEFEVTFSFEGNNYRRIHK